MEEPLNLKESFDLIRDRLGRLELSLAGVADRLGSMEKLAGALAQAPAVPAQRARHFSSVEIQSASGSRLVRQSR